MKPREIIEVKPQGFCGGVSKAIAKARATRREFPDEKITILGNLVHNTFVTEALKLEGIDTIDAKNKTRLELLDEIDSGIVIFTAHGVSQEVQAKAQAKGLKIVDASCPFVLTTQKLVKNRLAEGSVVFYIGKKGHPEAESIYLNQDQVYLIEKAADIPTGITAPIFVTNQTTMSLMDIQDLFDAIKARYPQAQFHDELCNATRIRQQALLDLAGQDIDLLVVVGDPASNNTAKLEAIGRQAGIPEVIRIGSAQDLQGYDLTKYQRAAVTSGASTPAYLRLQVLEKLAEPGQDPVFDLSQLLNQ